MNNYSFQGTIWVSNGASGWHFVTLPQKLSMTIKELHSDLSPGFGSVPVIVSIAAIEWETSIFFDTKADAYFLPLKGPIRKKARLKVGDRVEVNLRVKA